MATQITNQATLTYRYAGGEGSAASNIATATLKGQLSADMNSLFTDYRVDDELTYTISITNNSDAAVTNIQVEDDLGTYAIAGPANVTPLTYTGPAKLYINGVYSSDLTPVTADNSVTFTIPSLAAGAAAMIMYVTEVNQYALQDSGSILVNGTSVTADGMTDELYASYELDAEDFADVRIIKSMSPDMVTGGGMLTYTFALYNYGNTAATNVVLTDAFDPAPSNITVSIGASVAPATEYSYENGVLTLPSEAASALSITIPAATFKQDAATGRVTADPGVVMMSVTGTVR